MSNHFDTDANLTVALFTALMILLDPKPYTLSDRTTDSISGESCQPPWSHTYSGVPKAPLKVTFHPSILSLFILLISFLYQSNAGMLFNLHNRPPGVCGGPPLKQTLKLSYSYYHFVIHPTLVPQRSWQRQRILLFLLLYHECRGVYLNARLFLLTWTRSKAGSLGLYTSLACNSWTSWFQHRGESGVGGREVCSLTDVQYTQLMPQAGKSNNIICARQYWWISYLLPNMSIGRGENIATAANTTMLTSFQNGYS